MHLSKKPIQMKIPLLILTLIFQLFTLTIFAQKGKVDFKNDIANKKVEVLINGKLFTAYIYPDNMEKQSLYPIISASGKTITRGYPLDPRPFERTDHPHHVGMWFNFGDVNGLDFWNNSFAIKPADKPKYGTIKFNKIVSLKPKKGELITQSNWVDHTNKVLLNETSTFVFGEKNKIRTIERTTKLTAADEVTFKENKEGLVGLRLDRAFEEPATKPEIFLDASGKETLVPAMNNDGVNGVYHNAEGAKGGDVWGKRSPWVALRTVKEGEVLTLVILDHPKNPNYPAWSHARGYGLFASNNLGGRAFDKNAAEMKIVLKKGESLTFKHTLVIGNEMSDSDIQKLTGDLK